MIRAARAPWVVWSAIFLLALVLRVTVAIQYTRENPLATRPVIDEAAYDRWAVEIAGGDLASDHAFFQEPLYSYLLGAFYALFGHDLLAVRIVQGVLGALTAVLVGALGVRVYGRTAGILAGIAFALYRPALLLPALLLKETLFLFVLVLLALALLETRRRAGAALWLAVGFLAAAGALLRGNLFVIGPLLCAWPLARALRAGENLVLAARHGLLTLGAWLATLAPAIVHNVRADGLWLPTSGAGTNFAIGNALSNRWGRPGELDFVRGIPEYEADDWRREAERRTGRAMGPGEVSSYWLGETLASMRAHPLEHVALLWRKLRLALSSYEVPDNHHLEWDAQYVPVLRWPLGGFGVWGWLGLAGLIAALTGGYRSFPHDRAGAREIALLAALYLATVVLTMTSMRIRLGVLPLLLPFAGAFLARALALVRMPGGGRQEIGGLVGAAILAGVIVHAPLVDARTREQDWLGRDFNLAVALERSGDYRAARSIAITLDEKEPGTARVRILAAQCDYDAAQDHARAGLEEEARVALASARDWIEPLLVPPLAIARERWRASALAGRIAYALEEWENAAAHFAAALEFTPDDCDLALLSLRARRRATAQQEPEPRTAALMQLESSALALASVLAGSRDHGLLEVERAELEFDHARALHEHGPDRAAEAATLREAALARLRPLAEDASLPAEVRIEARLAAASIQLYLGRTESAKNHLEAALAIDPTQRRARALLDHLEADR